MAKKLHEYLGSQAQLFGQAKKIREDLITLFDKKKEHFRSVIQTFQPDAEGKSELTEQHTRIQTTVPAELKFAAPIFAKALDSEATIDKANTIAKADVVLDNGNVLLRDVPATQLLQLDKRLGELKEFVDTIPTLDPVKGFVREKDSGFGVYRALDVTKRRTSKEQMPLTLAQATDKHPAQVQLITKDVEIGTIKSQEWSGLTTPLIKAEILTRVEELRRAVKQARARANDVQIEEVKIGAAILQHVFEPVLTE